MSSVSNDQRAHCKLARLFEVLKNDCSGTTSAPSATSNLVEKILSEIKDVNFNGVNSNKTTPLHIACHHKHHKAFDIILKRGADFTAIDKNGHTVLHRAFYSILPRFDEKEETTGTIENVFIQSLLRAHVESGTFKNPRSADGLSHFHIACAFNHLDAVRLFLDNRVSLNEVVSVDSSTFPGYSPLHFAVRFGCFETAKLLLERGAVVAKDANKVPPLRLVVARKYKFIQLRIGRSSEDIKQLDKYATENERIIRLLTVDNRVPRIDEVGFSKLHAACTLNNTKLAEDVLRYFDVNHAISVKSEMWPGYTALHFAVHFNQINIVKVLLKSGADIEAKDANGVTPFDLCREKYEIKDLYDALCAIPGFKEIRFSDRKKRLSDFILAMWTTSTLESFFQSTPVEVHLPKNCPLWPGFSLSHLAVLCSDDEADSVAERYFDVCSKTVIQDGMGRTALHLAFYLHKYNIVNLLFKNELGKTNVIDNDGLSHLHIACRCATANEVRTLLTTSKSKYASILKLAYKGIPLVDGLNRGSKPLHFAVASGKADITRLLLQYGDDPNATDARGMTPIHCILTLCPPKRRKKIGDLLLLCDLKDKVSNKTGISHLHVASYIGNECAVQRLLELGANVNVSITYNKHYNVDIDAFYSRYSGYTPLHLALEENHARIVKLLLHCEVVSEVTSDFRMFSEESRYCCEREDVVYGHVTTTSFTLMFVNDLELQKRIEESFGLTVLHIACYRRDTGLIQRLLDDPRVNVNAQTHPGFSIWPRATPLHVLMNSAENINDLVHTVQLLLNRGADATLMDSNGITPLLRVFDIQPEQRFTLHFAREFIRLMLKCQKNFSINPVNKDGFSHFHVACMFYEYSMVEKFLENGVDVNLPIYYCNNEMIFQTPLHVVFQSKWDHYSDIQSQLRTIDVLLVNGADVNVQNENGLTPFHVATRKTSSRELFFQRLHEAGADMNCRTPDGQSVLEIVLNSSTITKGQLEFFLTYSNNLNTFNSVDGTGLISKILFHQSINHCREFIVERMLQTPRLFTTDSTGRTPIHNIVANHETSISTDDYVYYIEGFIKMGYDIDDQDFSGKTAVHMAAEFHNEKAILGLLIAGADINVTDANNRTAYTMWHDLWGPRLKNNNFLYRLRRAPQSSENDINKALATHIIRLQFCHLEVNAENAKLANKELDKNEVRIIGHNASKEFNDSNLVTIGTMTLKDFLTETLLSRPSMMSVANREAIDQFFESSNNGSFPELNCVLKLQYRKAMRILRLMDLAIDSLRRIVGSARGVLIPEICCRMIIRFLTNTEMKHLIISALATETGLISK